MDKTIYRNMEEADEMKGQLGGFAWWPLLGVLGIPGGLLSWEALSPLPEIPVQAVSFAALGLLFLGIALWLILLVKK